MKDNAPPKLRFEQSLHELARSTSIWNVFSDFLDYSLLMMRWWDLKETHFADLEKKYPEKKQHELFAKAYVAMGDLADNDGTGFKDSFGDFYMEYLSNDRKGQFFTPQPICDMLAAMQIGSNLPDNSTVADPCCGSGRLLLSAAKMNRKALFYAADIDPVCCKMTVLNFLMNTVCGEVAWMNTLTMEHWKSWHLKRIMDGNAMYRPYYIETDIGQTKFATSDIVEPVQHAQHSIIKQSVKEKVMEKWKEKPSQLTFVFD